MQPGVMLPEDRLDAIDVVVMTVGQQNIGDAHALALRQRQHLRHIPGGIDDRRAATGLIVDQVDEILHGSQFQGMEGKRLCVRHGIQPRLTDNGIRSYYGGCAFPGTGTRRPP
jgi:hypothetical protein